MSRLTWEELVITVRDRRVPRQFSIHNRLIDEWVPIIGEKGFALYAFYVRLSNRKDERAFPGFALINAHFGFSRQTISLYNRLLVWCGLIHIERGNRRRSNDYYILETPVVNEETLARVRRLVVGELEVGKEYQARFQRLVVGRLDAWRPIQALWGKKSTRVITVTRAQLELDLRGDEVVQPVNEGGTAGVPQEFSQCTTVVQPVNEGGSPSELEQSEENNPKGTIQREQSTDNSGVVDVSSPGFWIEVLEGHGISREVAMRLVEEYGVERVKRQYDVFPARVAQTELSGKPVRSRAGLLIAAIEGDWKA